MFENDEVFEIMRKSYLEYGSKVFTDKNRLSAYMVDLLVEYPLERKRLLLAVNENIIYKMVREIGCYDSAKFSMLSSELVQIYEIPEEMANYIVSVFSYALFGKKTQNVYKKTELKHNANSELITSSVDFTEFISLDKYTGNESTVVVPNRIFAIGNEAFQKNKTIKKVVLPDTIKCIGSAAFQDSTLEEINIPDGIEYISTEAFSRCKSLTTIKWNNASSLKLYGIGVAAFGRCESLKEVVLPEGVKYLMQSAFTRCSVLEKVVLPNSLTTIDAGAFWCCPALKEITIPKDTHINETSFEHCDDIVLKVHENSYALSTAQKIGLKYEIIEDNENDTFLKLTKRLLSKD